MPSAASATDLGIPLARTGVLATDSVVQARTETGSHSLVASGFRFAVNMTNAPFDLEASRPAAKVQSATPIGYCCSPVVHSQSLRQKNSWRRHWIAGLLALVVCLAAIFVTIAVVRNISHKHKVKYIKCDVRDDIVGGQYPLLCGNTISKGFQRPSNKQGIHDQRFYDDAQMRPTDSVDLADARYGAYMEDIQPGVRRYNVFWHAFEGSSVLPSQLPLSCAPGYQQVPASQDELQSKGYNRYHCYASNQIQLFEAYLALDFTYSIQSCATIWDIPDPPFRSPYCGGQIINNQTNMGGCIPQDADVMLDFQDFVNFVAEHYNSDTGGRFTHYIIWNEVANGDWFDPSPMIDAKQAISQQDTNLWLDTYALMMRLAHDAIARHRKAPTMLYISLDQIWEKPAGGCPPYLPGLQHCHIGSLNVVRGMWERLGLSIDWSLAIHPYGNPMKADWPIYFHFADIDRIAAFQVSMLQKAGAADPHRWPQAMMAATEQGWPAVTKEQQMEAASYICAAHDIVASSPYALFVTHNDFQAPFTEDRTGLVPRWTGRTLNNTDRMQSTTFAAYSASHPDIWNTDPSHFCCTMHQRGCPTSAGKAKAPAYASN